MSTLSGTMLPHVNVFAHYYDTSGDISHVMGMLYRYFSTTSTRWGVSNPHGGVDFGAVAAGGSGYAAGDTVTVSGGTGTAATLEVLSVDGSGGVTDARITTEGNYTVYPANPVSTTGGSGTGVTFTLNPNGSHGFTLSPTLSGENFQVNLRRTSSTVVKCALDPEGTITDSNTLAGASAQTSTEADQFTIDSLNYFSLSIYGTYFYLFEWEDAFIILQERSNSRELIYRWEVEHGFAAGRMLRPTLPSIDGHSQLNSSPLCILGHTPFIGSSSLTTIWLKDWSSGGLSETKIQMYNSGTAGDWDLDDQLTYVSHGLSGGGVKRQNEPYISVSDYKSYLPFTPIFCGVNDRPLYVLRYILKTGGTLADPYFPMAAIRNSSEELCFATFSSTPAGGGTFAIPVPDTFNPWDVTPTEVWTDY